MEWVAEIGFSKVSSELDALRDMIARRCSVRRWDAWVEPLFVWVQQMLSTPLPIGSERSLRLDALNTVKAEMEFWFEASDVDLSRLDAAVVKHTLNGRPRPALSHESINGMLKGFMDLVFEYQGRYYVADYKSNWLGPTDGDYTVSAMDEAIRSHRYDLQYVIYLFALHRLLRSRIPDYEYDRHVGGAAYLFVRGINAATAGVHFERPPKALMDLLDGIFTGNVQEDV
jgi:exodeoxyribonuclease V beta subunit